MAEQSAIAWTRSTFNPWIGCTKVSPGCDHCYASVSTPARTMGIQWGAGQARRRTSPANWTAPLRWNKAAPSTTFAGRKGFWPVFCSSLADVFDNEVYPKWRADLFNLIQHTPNLTWLLLTKRIGNAADMMIAARHGDETPLPNVWLGATIVNQAEADRDIPKLLATPAAKRFVSYEPALGPIRFTGIEQAERLYVNCLMDQDTPEVVIQPALDWIIVGGESDQPGMKARPFDVEWARSTVRECKACGVPVFVKQLGSAPKNWCAALLNADADCRADCEADHCDNYEAGEQGVNCFKAGARCVYLEDRAGADPAEWPEDLRVQEFPLA